MNIVIIVFISLGLIIFIIYEISLIMTKKIESTILKTKLGQDIINLMDAKIRNKTYYDKLHEDSSQLRLYIGEYNPDINYLEFKNAEELSNYLLKKEEEVLNKKIETYKKEGYSLSEINDIINKDSIKEEKKFVIKFMITLTIMLIVLLYISYTENRELFWDLFSCSSGRCH